MITFMEWVVLTEAFNHAFRSVLIEGKRGGAAVDYHNYAKMFTTFVMDAIEKGSYPDSLKRAAAELREQLKDKHTETELTPSVLGGKMRGRLSKISPNDQEEVIMTAAKNYWQVLPRILGDWDKVNDEMISPEDLAGRISGSVQEYVGYAVKEHFRRFSRKSYKHHGTPLSDIGDDEDGRPEASYEDGDDAMPVRSGVEITPKSWNDGIRVLMKVREKVHEYMAAKAGPKKDKPATPTKPISKPDEKIKLLDTSLALMRNMPHQMAQQLDFKDGGDDKMSGDEQIYHRLKSMIEDDTSDIDPADRAVLAQWGALDRKQEYQIRQPKQVVAAALWVGSGMVASQKPAILKGGNEKTFPEDNWFFSIIHNHDINAEELGDGDDTELYRKPVAPAPVKKPVSAPTATPVAPAPARKPVITEKPAPRGPSVQRGLFDDMD